MAAPTWRRRGLTAFLNSLTGHCSVTLSPSAKSPRSMVSVAVAPEGALPRLEHVDLRAKLHTMLSGTIHPTAPLAEEGLIHRVRRKVQLRDDRNDYREHDRAVRAEDPCRHQHERKIGSEPKRAAHKESGKGDGEHDRHLECVEVAKRDEIRHKASGVRHG